MTLAVHLWDNFDEVSKLALYTDAGVQLTNPAPVTLTGPPAARANGWIAYLPPTNQILVLAALSSDLHPVHLSQSDLSIYDASTLRRVSTERITGGRAQGIAVHNNEIYTLQQQRSTRGAPQTFNDDVVVIRRSGSTRAALQTVILTTGGVSLQDFRNIRALAVTATRFYAVDHNPVSPVVGAWNHQGSRISGEDIASPGGGGDLSAHSLAVARNKLLVGSEGRVQTHDI